MKRQYSGYGVFLLCDWFLSGAYASFAQKRVTHGLPFNETDQRVLALRATAVLRVLVPFPGAGFLASNPNSCPLSLVSVSPCFSLQSLQGCIQCIVLFPVILDDHTIAIDYMETYQL